MCAGLGGGNERRCVAGDLLELEVAFVLLLLLLAELSGGSIRSINFISDSSGQPDLDSDGVRLSLERILSCSRSEIATYRMTASEESPSEHLLAITSFRLYPSTVNK